jgi:hypothetical protein
MQAAMRPYAAASAALIGASVIAVNPAVYPDLEQGQDLSGAAVRLASTDVLPDLTLQDLENIPYNFFASIANIPYYEFSAPIDADTIAGGALAYTTIPTGDVGAVGVTPIPEISHGAIGFLDNVLAYEGNFFLLNAVNVLGIDPGDPGKIAAFADLLSGNPDVGSAVSAQLIPILEAELPLQAGCTAVSAGGCPDPLEILMGSNQSTGFDPLGTHNLEVPGYLSVPLQDFFSSSGYTFPGTETDPLLNPVPSGEPIGDVGGPGFPPGTPTDPIPLGTDGSTYYETLPWSGETVHLDPNGPADAYFAYLTQDPSLNPIMFPSLQDVTTDLNGLTTGLFNTFNPFVNGTYCLPCAPFVPGDTTNPITSLFPPGTELSSLTTEFSSLLGGSAALPADLSSLFDPSTFTTDLAALLGTSSTDLTALLGGSGADLLSSILPDIATFLPF